MRQPLRLFCGACSLSLACGYAVAADPLPAKEIKSLYSGRVAERTTRDGDPMTIKFLSGGQLEGRIWRAHNAFDQGKWWVPEDGKVCVQWDKWRRNQKICNGVEREGGTVYRIDRKGRRHELGG